MTYRLHSIAESESESRYDDSISLGFSHTYFSGAGHSDLGNVSSGPFPEPRRTASTECFHPAVIVDERESRRFAIEVGGVLFKEV